MKELRRIISIGLVLLLLLSLVPLTVTAKAGTKEVKRAIGIVYDNSGSMYIGSEEGRKVWCRATYATEAFAAMMNKGDILQVYPMNPIEVNGTKYTYKEPLQVDQASASTIRQIYTPSPGDTHIEVIKAACEGILQVQADEKWVVVVTDGDEFYRNKVGLGTGKGTISALEKDLSECAQKLNVMYLGMGKQSAMPEKVEGSYFYTAKKTANSTEVLAALSEMCNIIFGRDSLPDVGETVSFDLPMSKLILFVQGEGIQNVKLGDLKASSTVDMKYSTLGAGASYKSKFLVDENLQGTMMIYENVEAGQLKVSYEGNASRIDCYYEPDVDLEVAMLDGAGNPVDPTKEQTSGTYLLSYHIVDKHGTPVNSRLLGETNYAVIQTLNQKDESFTSQKGEKRKVELKPGDTLEFRVKATYLGGYTLEKDSADLGWPEGGLTFVPPPAGTLEIRLSGGAEEYKLSKLAEGAPFRAEFIYDGQTLTGDQLKNLEELTANLEGGNAQCRLEEADGTYQVYLSPNDVVHETKCGSYELHLSAIYRNQDGLPTNRALAAAEFKLKDDSRSLKMEVQTPQTYYQISELAESKPITVKLSYSGQPLTKEELDGVTLEYTAKGLTLLQEKDPANSAILLRLDPKNAPDDGEYDIKITAKGVNEVGKEQICKGETAIETGTWPMWLKILVPILIIALLITLIVLFLNQKVLPKDVGLRSTEFSVDGTKIQGSTARIENPGKKQSDIIITSARYGMDPGAAQQMTLTVTALTNRLTPSHKRKYTVDAVKLKNATQVMNWELKGTKYKADPNKPGSFKSVTNGNAFKPTMAGPKTAFFIKAETRQGTAVTFRGTLECK